MKSTQQQEIISVVAYMPVYRYGCVATRKMTGRVIKVWLSYHSLASYANQIVAMVYEVVISYSVQSV